MKAMYAERKKQSRPTTPILIVAVMLLAVVIYLLIPRSGAAETKIPKPTNTSNEMQPEVPLVEIRHV
jgi:flagellar basal body-associated protein FliL